MNKLIVIVGPTGIGKTVLATKLASSLSGEIVNADSRQIYRYMDIGTAKPDPETMTAVKHHLIDIIEPDREFSLAEYQKLAYAAIQDIHARGKLPFLVGGSGLYIWAVLEGWVIPEVSPKLEFRREQEERAEKGQAAELYQELKNIDPVAAGKIDPRNVRRVIRALEVSRFLAQPFSQLQKKRSPPFKSFIIGLTTDRTELYRRADERVDNMIEQGFVDEVRRLLEIGYNLNLPSMSSIGYREIGLYLQGELTLDEAIYKIKVGTHRFIRHQYAWFRLKDERIKWFDIAEMKENDIQKLVRQVI
jgi:tRNA dimethylallyltransferase